MWRVLSIDPILRTCSVTDGTKVLFGCAVPPDLALPEKNSDVIISIEDNAVISVLTWPSFSGESKESFPARSPKDWSIHRPATGFISLLRNVGVLLGTTLNGAYLLLNKKDSSSVLSASGYILKNISQKVVAVFIPSESGLGTPRLKINLSNDTYINIDIVSGLVDIRLLGVLHFRLSSSKGLVCSLINPVSKKKQNLIDIDFKDMAKDATRKFNLCYDTFVSLYNLQLTAKETEMSFSKAVIDAAVSLILSSVRLVITGTTSTEITAPSVIINATDNAGPGSIGNFQANIGSMSHIRADQLGNIKIGSRLGIFLGGTDELGCNGVATATLLTEILTYLIGLNTVLQAEPTATSYTSSQGPMLVKMSQKLSSIPNVWIRQGSNTGWSKEAAE